MNDKIDGTAAGPTMSKEQLDKANAMLAQLEQPVRAIIYNTLAGLLASFQQAGIPPHVILSMAAMQAGMFMGTCIQGELMSVLKIRKSFKEAFDEGLNKTKPNVVPAGPVPGLKLNG